MKKILAVALAGSLISTPAFAETFSGPYVGVQAGLDNYEIQAEDVFVDGDEFDGISGNGIEGGIFAGYDYSLGNTFVGVEVSADLSDAKAIFSNGTDELRISAEETYGASARFGAMLNGSTALYGRAGWANTKFKVAFDGESESDRDDALVLGAGIETRVGAGSLRVEYIRADYADEVKNNRVALGYGFRF
jgi:outer membrane immunogenic protein